MELNISISVHFVNNKGGEFSKIEEVLSEEEIFYLLEHGQKHMALLSGRLLEKCTLYVARNSKELMGVIAVIHMGRQYYEIGPIIVLPDFEKKGVGTALMRAVEIPMYAKAGIWVSNNLAAIKLIKKVNPNCFSMLWDERLMVGLFRLRILLWPETWKGLIYHSVNRDTSQKASRGDCGSIYRRC
jgi:GNAT superfamily N-acetyltransferase